MNKQDIENYLRLVGQELHAQGHMLDLLLLGGAAMLIEVGNRESTQDVDTYFVSNTTALFRAAANVAQRDIYLMAGSTQSPQALPTTFSRSRI